MTGSFAAAALLAVQFSLAVRNGAITDTAKHLDAKGIQAKGVEIVPDAKYGEVMRFGGKGSIVVADGGRLSMKDGLTIEAWIWPERIPEKGFGIAHKDLRKAWDRSAFEFTLTENGTVDFKHVACDGLEQIDFTEDEMKHHWTLRPRPWYPGRHGASHGALRLQTNAWNRVTFTYDGRNGASRIWVNGRLDREFFTSIAGFPTALLDDDEAPVTLFSGAKDLRVAGVRMVSRSVAPGELPPVRVTVHEKRWPGDGYVHIRTLRDDLEYPIDVIVMNTHLRFGRVLTEEARLEGPGEINVPIPKGMLSCVPSDLTVSLMRKGREIHRMETLVVNPHPASPRVHRIYSHKPAPEGVPPRDKPEWAIAADNTFELKRKPVFPLVLWGCNPTAWELAADVGFTMLSIRIPKDLRGKTDEVMEEIYAKAAARGVTVVTHDHGTDRAGQGFIIAMDEPWNFTFETFRRRFQELANGRAHPAELPIVATQNNWSRYRDTAQCCDVLAPDPYCKGRDPFRLVYDSVRTAIRDTDGRTPILPIIANYARERPDADEFRAQCYLAIAAGAPALGVYSWDDGEKPGGPQDTGTMPDQLASYRNCFAELKALEPALTTPNVEDAVRIEPAAPRGFFPCLKRGRDGREYVIVATDLYRTATKKVVAPSLAGKSLKIVARPVRKGLRPTEDELKFDGKGVAELTLPPVSAAVFATDPVPMKGRRK